MPYTTLVAGTTITAAWGNANVRDQVITPFVSSTSRASQISVPVNGMLSFLTDLRRFEGYDSTTTSWVPVPGTMIAYGNRQTDKTYTGTEVGVLRLDSITVKAGFRYLIMSSSLRLGVVTGETGKASIRYSTTGSATTSDTVLSSVEANVNTAFTPAQTPAIITSYTPASSGTLSILLTVYRSGGSGNVTMTGNSAQPIELYVVVAAADPGDTGVDI